MGEEPCMMQLEWQITQDCDNSGRVFFGAEAGEEVCVCCREATQLFFSEERFPRRARVFIETSVFGFCLFLFVSTSFTAFGSPWPLAGDPSCVESCWAAMWRDTTCLHSPSFELE